MRCEKKQRIQFLYKEIMNKSLSVRKIRYKKKRLKKYLYCLKIIKHEAIPIQKKKKTIELLKLKHKSA